MSLEFEIEDDHEGDHTIEFCFDDGLCIEADRWNPYYSDYIQTNLTYEQTKKLSNFLIEELRKHKKGNR